MEPDEVWILEERVRDLEAVLQRLVVHPALTAGVSLTQLDALRIVRGALRK